MYFLQLSIWLELYRLPTSTSGMLPLRQHLNITSEEEHFLDLRRRTKVGNRTEAKELTDVNTNLVECFYKSKQTVTGNPRPTNDRVWIKLPRFWSSVGHWWLELQEYEFDIVYRPGSQMKHDLFDVRLIFILSSRL